MGKKGGEMKEIRVQSFSGRRSFDELVDALTLFIQELIDENKLEEVRIDSFSHAIDPRSGQFTGVLVYGVVVKK